MERAFRAAERAHYAGAEFDVLFDDAVPLANQLGAALSAQYDERTQHVRVLLDALRDFLRAEAPELRTVND